MGDVDVAETDIAGLPAYPFIGPDDNPFVPVTGADLERLERPVGKVKLPFGGWAWLVTRHEDVRQLLRHPGFSSDQYKPGFPVLNPIPPKQDDASGLFIFMDGEAHSRFRKMLTAEFMIKNIRRIEPLIEETVVEALDRMEKLGAPADLMAEFALPVPSMTICHLLGVPYADHDFFQDHSRVIMDRKSGPAEVEAALGALAGLLGDLVEAKRENPGEDLLSRLTLERVDTGELRKDELVSLAMLLLVAGHETTANMIGLSALVLLQHPEHLEALREDPSLAPGMVEELLRYLTVVRTGLPRLAMEDAEIGGQRIRAGEGVVAMLAMSNRDQSVFSDPDLFDPQRREAHRHMAFGFGLHQCIGQPLARAELRVALVELARRFPELRSELSLADVPQRPMAVTFGVAELPVTW
ncbi:MULTISPECIES: cytochrome P450 [Streptomyces]|uniref:Cytochrome P450 n=1 Tax=Streptomyces venezuelae TaxID=54571 RepID=A0A5P2BJU5_STRVZ|nr:MULTISPECIES: cytochrome P450 [unclassified Streptomyces]NEA03242.1 cytochrome P450 [Streptomyces sp. SID10116]QES29421.1 cytochrome P450 [Streptomyces venezuelae]MYY86675.1 cytochrome P450 [Streptomyces sp. SID335]MYZ13879.1 cytochrome P450 [Streptomyces sp. SID337]NDZ91634.1 cytochrome P450 [Streptomyces sp. SID10115]